MQQPSKQPNPFIDEWHAHDSPVLRDWFYAGIDIAVRREPLEIPIT